MIDPLVFLSAARTSSGERRRATYTMLKNLAAFDEAQGWRALGYPSMSAFIDADGRSPVLYKSIYTAGKYSLQKGLDCAYLAFSEDSAGAYRLAHADAAFCAFGVEWWYRNRDVISTCAQIAVAIEMRETHGIKALNEWVDDHRLAPEDEGFTSFNIIVPRGAIGVINDFIGTNFIAAYPDFAAHDLPVLRGLVLEVIAASFADMPPDRLRRLLETGSPDVRK